MPFAKACGGREMIRLLTHTGVKEGIYGQVWDGVADLVAMLDATSVQRSVSREDT